MMMNIFIVLDQK